MEAGNVAPSVTGPGTFTGSLVGGTETTNWEAVGIIKQGTSVCSGSLVGERTVLTAAHCFDYASSNMDGDYGTFTLTKKGGASFSAKIIRVHSFGSTTGTSDVAFAVLENCAASFVPPMKIAEKQPAAGANVTEVGFGCTMRAADGSCKKTPTDAKKREASFAWGSSTSGCPGDSGGPIINTRDNTIAAVFSAYSCNSSLADVYGNATTVRDDVSSYDSAFSCNAISTNLSIVRHPQIPARPFGFRDGQFIRLENYLEELSFILGQDHRGPKVDIRYVVGASGEWQLMSYRPTQTSEIEYGEVYSDQARVWLERPGNVRVEFPTDGNSPSDAAALTKLRQFTAHQTVMVRGKNLGTQAGGGSPGQVTSFQANRVFEAKGLH